jgi:AmmeMemoRadiSam system protein B
MLREALVAGQFYSENRERLLGDVEAMLEDATPEPSIAVMSPHAGYVYSGGVAGKTFSHVKIPQKVIILGPNHQGRGHAAAVYSHGAWETPLGRVEIASSLAERLLAECPVAADDYTAHLDEHSLEVQVPFLQFLAPGLQIVPFCIGHLPLDVLLDLGDGLARLISNCDEPPLVVASTDMTHYESGEIARQKDALALDRVLALDPEGLYGVVRENKISMCGVLPTVVMLRAALALGATQAELVAYSNSGDVTGDQSSVVGYAGVRVF